MISVLVLGGGPDAEHDVSRASSKAVADALSKDGLYEVHYEIIQRPTLDVLRAFPGDVVFPVLHGSFGEGGPLQDLLEADGRPYVGSGPRASRLAMDKIATKSAALSMAIPTAQTAVFDCKDEVCPLPLPVVVKPIHDGSSVGVHVCQTQGEWVQARNEVVLEINAKPGRAYMVESFIDGRELTVGMIDGEPLPTIEIVPADGLYDYEAKYHRDDTGYVLNPALPESVETTMQGRSIALCRALGIRHLARVDFMLGENDQAWLLEVNTIPGFTDHSLVPMAAAESGLEMSALCAQLVDMALRDVHTRSSVGEIA